MVPDLTGFTIHYLQADRSSAVTIRNIKLDSTYVGLFVSQAGSCLVFCMWTLKQTSLDMDASVGTDGIHREAFSVHLYRYPGNLLRCLTKGFNDKKR